MNDVWDEERARHWLASFDIPLKRKCGELSGGQQAQVALALAVGKTPSVLLLDEPLANLDPVARREVMDALLADVQESGMTVLFSTHVIAELDDLVDHLLLIRHGQVILNGDVNELLDQHLHTFDRNDIAYDSQIVYTSRRRTGEGREWSLLRKPSDSQALSPDARIRRPNLEEMVVGYLDTSAEVNK